MIEYIVKVHDNGNREWYLNGKLHRIDGPAVEYYNGAKFWYLNGKYHRTDVDEMGVSLPAIEFANGDKSWYLNDKRHRTDGPALEYANGETQYFINNKHIPQLDNKRIYGEEKLTKLLVLI